MSKTTPSTVVFDIGQVLIEWDPRHLYRELFDGYEDMMEEFLDTVCTSAWNLEQDRGRPWAEAVALLTAEHPDCAELIRAYDEQWERMVPGPIAGTPEILAELKARGVPVYAITNFSADKFELARKRFDFLNSFEGVIVSGTERLVKPDPAIYRLLLDRYGLDAKDCFFIDDSVANVESARSVGMTAHHFAGAEALRQDLEGFGLL
ncbi:HAD family hydrolase [Azospirillum doebereinerae]|uniref:HAD family phosphatase n=1 Tax=Azospirillum doebereinerae TaxID=92933 RepID=A0A3S0WXG9_9PROT|nr:HAD family phosphatase [Azospirillum doebereinerae]RUQ75027.1 HAD family phosphatase [Azospirillum doebereinerae]